MRIRYIPIVCFLCAVACAPPKVQTKPELPSELKPVATFTPVPSVINVPIELKTWYIEKMLNEQLAPLLYECDTLTIAGIKPVKMKVWKKDSIRIALEGNEMAYKVPLKIWLQFSFTIGALGISHTEYQDVEAEIALKLRSKFSVKNNWKVVTQTSSDGYEWLSEPVIKVRFISIPIKPVVDIILSSQQASFGGLVDSAVCNSLDIKKMLRPLWNRIQAPILLSSAPDSIWLRLSPTSVYMTQLTGNNGIIKGSLGIKSVAETFFGGQPETKAFDSLPEFIVPERLDSSFVINLYTELPFSSASQILQGFLLGKAFSTAGKEVIIQDVNIYGLEGYAVVSIDFTGSFRGKVYVIGHVKYDEAEATASIEDLDFDLSTKNALHSTAEWLLHGIILAKVKPYLHFPLRERLLEAQLMVQKMLSHKEISKNVFITGAIDSLSIGGVTITDKAIKAILLAKGTLNVLAHD
ncbi:MAG TPA: DUF4403 family protein [Chitinivibrionales bacterium]|nr:DUF4403 family protein [Chitinivibrionales bacterium]